ncbi:MAG: peptide-modifying radical SAM enzyme CbpB [Nitrospinota bacterium]
MIDKFSNKGLSFSDIDTHRKLALNPDNLFWGILPKKKGDTEFLLPEDLLSLYVREKGNLDKELHDFRFNPDLNCIYIDPTDRCNASCPYCYIPSEIRKQGTQMSGKQLDTVLKKIARYFRNSERKPVIVFHASEPLLVKEIIFKAVDKFSNQFLFGLQTNAILLEKREVGFLKKHRVGVGISLDSFDPDINNRQRISVKGGNFNKAVQAIEWFNGYAGLNVISTVTRLNVRHLPDLVKFLHERKVGCVLLNPVRVTQKPALKLLPDQKIFARYFIDAVNNAMDLSRRSGRRIVIGNFANLVLAIIAPTARRMMCDISPCGGGRTFLTITAQGDMIPCGEFIGLKEFSGGNIFETSISRAMRSRPFREVRERFVEKIDECSICDYRNICGSPCPAELYARGNMYQPSVFCEFYKEIIKYAFRLIAEDKVKYLLREDAMKQLKYRYKYR